MNTKRDNEPRLNHWIWLKKEQILSVFDIKNSSAFIQTSTQKLRFEKATELFDGKSQQQQHQYQRNVNPMEIVLKKVEIKKPPSSFFFFLRIKWHINQIGKRLTTSSNWLILL